MNQDTWFFFILWNTCLFQKLHGAKPGCVEFKCMTLLVDDGNGVLWWNRWKTNCDFWIPGLSSKWEFKVNFGSSYDRDALNDFYDHRWQELTVSKHPFCPIWDMVHAVMVELRLEHGLLSNIASCKLFSPLCTAFSDLYTKLGALVFLVQGLEIFEEV